MGFDRHCSFLGAPKTDSSLIAQRHHHRHVLLRERQSGLQLMRYVAAILDAGALALSVGVFSLCARGRFSASCGQ